MNRVRIIQLRNHLATLKPQRFDLSSWFSDIDPVVMLKGEATKTNSQALEGSCGSSACIAGHALALFAPDDRVPTNPLEIAASILELTYEEARTLFTPHEDISEFEDEWNDPRSLPDGRDLESIELSEAIKVLNHLIKTNKVDWRVIA